MISMGRHVRLPAAWFPFFLVLLIGVLVMALVFLLVFLLEFNFETSPAWQVGVYYLMLGLLFFVTFVVGFHQPQGFGVRYRRMMLVLAGLTPLVIFVLGWVLGGAYLGPRDPRLFKMMVVSVSSFLFLWMVIALPYSWYLLARVFFRRWRHSSSTG